MVNVHVFLRVLFRPHRLAWPRTLPFQGSNTGSNPVGDTTLGDTSGQVSPFQGQGTVWDLSYTGRRLSGDLPMRRAETVSLSVTLPNEQRMEIPEAGIRWSRGQKVYAPCPPITQITECSLLIRSHATAHTPGAVGAALNGAELITRGEVYA